MKLNQPLSESQEKARVRRNRLCLLVPPSFWLIVYSELHIEYAVLSDLVLPLFFFLLFVVVPALFVAINSASQRPRKEAAISLISGWALFLCPLVSMFFE